MFEVEAGADEKQQIKFVWPYNTLLYIKTEPSHLEVPHDLLMLIYKEDVVGACNDSCSPSNYNRDGIID